MFFFIIDKSHFFLKTTFLTNFFKKLLLSIMKKKHFFNILLELSGQKKFIPKISLKNLEEWSFRSKNKKISKQTFEYLFLKIHFSRFFNEILGMNFISCDNSKKIIKKNKNNFVKEVTRTPKGGP